MKTSALVSSPSLRILSIRSSALPSTKCTWIPVSFVKTLIQFCIKSSSIYCHENICFGVFSFTFNSLNSFISTCFNSVHLNPSLFCKNPHTILYQYFASSSRRWPRCSTCLRAGSTSAASRTCGSTAPPRRRTGRSSPTGSTSTRRFLFSSSRRGRAGWGSTCQAPTPSSFTTPTGPRRSTRRRKKEVFLGYGRPTIYWNKQKVVFARHERSLWVFWRVGL